MSKDKDKQLKKGKKDKKTKKKTVSHTGSQVHGFHEGSRSEYLAHYAFSSFGTCIAIPHQEDTGIDLNCTLTKRVGKRIWPQVYYSVQVKSSDDPWVLDGKESVSWFIQHPSPLFYCVVTKKEARLRVYQTSPRFHAYAHPPLPARLELIPGNDTVGTPTQWDRETATFQLSAPILDFTVAQMGEDGFAENAQDVLNFLGSLGDGKHPLVELWHSHVFDANTI